MAKLIYATPLSLDSLIADETSSPDWAAPDAEGFAFISDLLRGIGVSLYGRKMYQTMAIWQTPEAIGSPTPAMMDFARIWQAAGKIVYSKTLETVATPNTHLEREFDVRAVGELKARSPHDISIGGPTLAAQAMRAGLVDEYHLFLMPAMIGAGKRVFAANVNVKLDLLDERRFGNGMIYLRYQTR